jgi:hypothetical protein
VKKFGAMKFELRLFAVIKFELGLFDVIKIQTFLNFALFSERKISLLFKNIPNTSKNKTRISQGTEIFDSAELPRNVAKEYLNKRSTNFKRLLICVSSERI